MAAAESRHHRGRVLGRDPLGPPGCPPPPGTYGAALSGVSCLGPAYCTAVGYYVMPGSHTGKPLAEHEG